MRARGARVIGAAFLSLGLSAAPVLAADPTAPAPRTPIEHAVVLMQEAHSFDNLFGSYPGVTRPSQSSCVLSVPGDASSTCVSPTWVGDRTVPAFGQSAAIFTTQYDEGKLDGFIGAQGAAGADASLVMGYYDDRDIPFSWNVADSYVLFDHFFSSAHGGSVSNHMYWISGSPGPASDSIPVDGIPDVPTIFDRLQEAGLTWKFYVQSYDPSITYRNRQGMVDRGSQVERVPVLAMARFLDDPALSGHVVDLSQYYLDLQAGTLPAVSYIVPAGGGAHSPSALKAEQQLGGSLINALTRSSAWSSSMFLWTYSGSGGWYDHLAPPQVDESGLGFRVPALLVSPFARRGYVDDTQLDYASIVRFITDNWNIRSLAARDAAAETFTSAFDFDNPGRAPILLSTTREVATKAEPRRVIIFFAYGLALVGAILLIGRAALRSRRPRDQDHATKVL